jgi:hypothetical protein
MGRLIALGAAAIGVAAPLGFVPAASAQEAESPWRIEASAAVVGSGVEEDSALAPAGDGFLFDGSLVVSREDTLSHGLVLTWRAEGRVQRDAASRPGFAGVLGSCSPANAACPRVASGGGFLPPVSPATGLSTFGAPLDEDIFAALEGASLSVAGPWGEGLFGVDSGVAARLDARAPTVLTRVSAFSPSLDPTGLSLARARNDVAGPALKVSYMTPRILGFRLGATYTPEASERSVDFDPRPDIPGGAQADLEHIFEGAVSFARTDRASGLRIRAALTGTWADSASPYVQFGAYSAMGAGLELERGPWTVGLRWLKSDNAWRANGADYEAVEFGLVWQGEKWRFGLEAADAHDDLATTEGISWLAGASRKLNDWVDVGVAWTSAEADIPSLGPAGFGHINASNSGLVVELSVHK